MRSPPSLDQFWIEELSFFGDRSGLDELVVQSLVMTLSVVVLDELANDEPKVRFAEGDDVVEAFASSGSNEALGKCVQIGAMGRQPNSSDASSAASYSVAEPPSSAGFTGS